MCARNSLRPRGEAEMNGIRFSWVVTLGVIFLASAWACGGRTVKMTGGHGSNPVLDDDDTTVTCCVRQQCTDGVQLPQCVEQHGQYGNFTGCLPNPCTQFGACCQYHMCADDYARGDCAGGAWYQATTCDQIVCDDDASPNDDGASPVG